MNKVAPLEVAIVLILCQVLVVGILIGPVFFAEFAFESLVNGVVTGYAQAVAWSLPLAAVGLQGLVPYLVPKLLSAPHSAFVRANRAWLVAAAILGPAVGLAACMHPLVRETLLPLLGHAAIAGIGAIVGAGAAIFTAATTFWRVDRERTINRAA